MELTIEQALGDRYLMFYNAAWPAQALSPGCTLEQSVSTVNQNLANNGRNITTWSARAQDEIARLLWVNWIYQRLDVEPIRKPILVHLHDNQLVVDCGDTRLMSIKLLSNLAKVSVICTTIKENASTFNSWTPVRNNQDLLKLTGFGNDAHIMLSPGTSYALEWLEIGDQTTSHHLHNIDQRVSMIHRYVNEQSDNFKFTTEWARSSINWDNYVS